MTKLLLILLLLSSHVYAAKDCVKKGTSSLWEFDQKKGQISFVEKGEQEVCNTFTNQLNANYEIKLFKKDKLVHTMKVYWSDLTFSSILEKDKMKPVITQKKDYKILKFPIAPSDMDSYKIYSLNSKQIISRGKL